MPRRNPLPTFDLENFLDQHEDVPGLVNLAGSDAQPWRLKELREKFPRLCELIANLRFGYPDPCDVKNMIFKMYNLSGDLDVLLTAGASHALSIVLLWLRHYAVNRSVVGIPKPSYRLVDGFSQILGIPCRYYSYDEQNSWRLNEKQCIDAASVCNLLYINNPHNPTGQNISESVIDDILRRLRQNQSFLLCDEVFLANYRRSIIHKGPRIIVVSSLSKIYGLPGIRFGWIIAPKNLIKEMKTIQQYTILANSVFSIQLASSILPNLSRISRVDLIAHNRKLLLGWANRNRRKVSISSPVEGTTVVLTFKLVTDKGRLFDSLLTRGILLAPGEYFSIEHSGTFRLGYGCSTQILMQGLRKIQSFVAER